MILRNHLDNIANKLINQVEEYPPLPTFVQKIMQLNADPDSTLAEISRVIEAEIFLSASIIKLVNSPLFCVSQPIVSISRAINVLGRNEVMNLVLAGVMYQSYKGVQYKQHYMSALGYHSFKCATVARYLGKLGDSENSDFFTAGLLHDIGKNIIYRNLPLALLKKTYGDQSMPVPDIHAEMEHFGIDHTCLGARLLSSWEFPAPLQAAVEYHHRPDLAREHVAYPLVVHVANILVHILETRVESQEEEGRELYPQLFTEFVKNGLHDMGIPLSGKNFLATLEELERIFSSENDLAEMFM